MTVVGLLWAIPFPVENVSPLVNWATLLLIPAMLFYIKLSVLLGLGMIFFSALTVLFVNWWSLNMDMSVLMMSIIVFVAAWILQFVGHKIEGKKPSFFKEF